MSLSDANVLSASSINSSNREFLTPVVLVVLADILLFDREPGLNLFLLANAITCGLLLCSRKRQSIPGISTFVALGIVATAPLAETASWPGMAVTLLGLSLILLPADAAVRGVREALLRQHLGRPYDWRSWTYRDVRLEAYLKGDATLVR